VSSPDLEISSSSPIALNLATPPHPSSSVVGTPSTSLVILPNLDPVPIPRVKPKLVNTVFNANKVQNWSFCPRPHPTLLLAHAEPKTTKQALSSPTGMHYLKMALDP
jgi:hypothetical protein